MISARHYLTKTFSFVFTALSLSLSLSLSPLTERIRITELPQEKIITANEKAQFTCQVNGVPDPTIKWLFNGQEIDTTNEWKIELRNDLIRTSMVNLNSSLGSGQVMCIGYHMEEGRLVMVSSEAHLIVLSKQSSDNALCLLIQYIDLNCTLNLRF